MADITPYADHKKAELIAALSTLPEGIQDFLTTEIPDAPTVGTPGDVDSAIIANGVCAKFVLDLFKPFAGFTPVEMMARIGQLNEWVQAGVLAGLQAWEGAQDDDGGGDDEEMSDFEIVAPQDGTTYQPGAIRFQVRATHGTLNYVTVIPLGGAQSLPEFDLKEENGVFYGMTYLRDPASYSFTVDGAFAGDRPSVQKQVAIIIASDGSGQPGETIGGDDLTGLDLLKKVFNDACQRVLSGTGSLGEVIAAARRVRSFSGGQGGASGGGGASGYWGSQADATIAAILQEGQE